MSQARPSLPKRVTFYALSVAAIVLTFLVRQAAAKYSGTELPQYVMFFPVVTLVALVVDLWAGLIATSSAAVLVAYWILPPQHSFSIRCLSDLVYLAIFVGSGGLTSAVCEHYRRAKRRASAYEKEMALRQAEDALSRYELLSEHSRDIILFVAQRDCRIVEANAAAIAKYGYSRDELLQLTIHQLRAPHTRRLTKQQVAEADQHGIRFETTHQRRDGSTFPVEVSSQGAVVAGAPVLISVIRDISERKQVEERLFKANQRLAALMNATPVGVSFSDDATCQRITGNPTVLAQFGVTARDNLSPSAPEKSAPGRQVRFFQNGRPITDAELPLQRAVAENRPIAPMELEVHLPDGRIWFTEASGAPIHDEKGNVIAGVAVTVDITARKNAEQSVAQLNQDLQRRAAELQTVFDTAPIGLAICHDPDGRHIQGNPAYERLLGLASGEELSLAADPKARYRPMRDGRELSSSELPMQRAVRGETVSGCVMEVEKPDGGAITLYASTAPLFDEQGQPRGAVGAFLDITQLKLAQEALRQSQEWLRVTLTSIGDAVIAADTDSRITFLNPAATALTGWEPSEANGKPIQQVFRIFNEETGTAAGDIVGQVLSEGRVLELANHTALLAKNGRLLPIEDSAAPIRDSNGNIVGVVLVFHDVTEKRRAQKALQQSAERYRKLVDLSPDAIIVHRNNRVEYVNPAAARLMGAATAEQILGKSPYDIFHPDFHDLIRDRMLRLKQGEQVPLIEEKIVRLDGRTVDVAVTATSFMDQNGPALQVILHDITGRKLREEQARRFNRTLKALNNSNQVLLRVSNEQELLGHVCRIITEDCGHAMVWIGFAQTDEQKSVVPVAYSGFDKGYLESLQITWADTERGQGPTGRAIRTGQPALCRDMLDDPKFAPWRAEAAMRGYCSSLAMPLLEEGSAFGAIALYSKDRDAFSDNEIKLLTELAADLAYGIRALRLRAAHERAQEALIRSEKLASVGRMAATIAHEINNPLAAVMNTLFLARGAAGLPPHAAQYLDICDAELKRISHITRQALGFYRESTAPALTSVRSILDSVLDLLAGKINAKRVTVGRAYDQDIRIMAVAGELRQVFSNLVSNSLDALGENGMIKLRVADSHPGSVRITVADNGKGIEAAARPHIFEPFFTTKTEVGIGLGLWVSKQIVEKHGGSIRLRSSTGIPRQGTVFSITLPAASQPVAAAHTAGARQD